MELVVLTFLLPTLQGSLHHQQEQSNQKVSTEPDILRAP
jgi:hypothetical protein